MSGSPRAGRLKVLPSSIWPPISPAIWSPGTRTLGNRYLQYGALVLLPALYFRISHPIFTHNSATLSLYLAVVLVYLPIKTTSVFLELLRSRVLLSHSYRKHGGSRFPSGLLATPPTQSTNRSRAIPWILAGIFVFWTYYYGLADPFPKSSELLDDPVFRDRNLSNASYFIAANFWNNEPVLPHWTREMTSLIKILGTKHVFLSLTENDSEDNTASMLLHYARTLTKMNVPHSLNITRELRGYPSNMPWHDIPHRMSYMANLRNGALQPLYENPTPFRSLILMNDVVFHHTDILKLIIASDDKTMACSLDMDGATLYDQWVLRDSCGRSTSGFWPFFMNGGDRAVVRRGGVLNVGTCWNGIVVLDADPFLNATLRREPSHLEPLRFPQPPGCIISECALLPLALVNQTTHPKVVMDSSVIVAYSVRWWNYYAVWMRTPVVQLWMRLFEEHWWAVWWWLFFRDGLRWVGLDDGKEKGECIVKGWPKCTEKTPWEPGTVTFDNIKGEL
ncbi:hypothetical protein AA313_de0209949 [Arthrobotrys entomopaga]|nr:hypothetical protein AA313_de0209949 [Arthrobotrys entomopaga]